MVLEKWWVSANFTRVSESRRYKLESRNLGLAKNKAERGISKFESWVSEAKRKNRHTITIIRHDLMVTDSLQKEC